MFEFTHLFHCNQYLFTNCGEVLLYRSIFLSFCQFHQMICISVDSKELSQVTCTLPSPTTVKQQLPLLPRWLQRTPCSMLIPVCDHSAAAEVLYIMDGSKKMKKLRIWFYFIQGWLGEGDWIYDWSMHSWCLSSIAPIEKHILQLAQIMDIWTRKFWFAPS